MTNPIHYYNNTAKYKIDDWYNFEYDTNKRGIIYTTKQDNYYYQRLCSQWDFYHKLKKNKGLKITEADLEDYVKFLYLCKKYNTSLIVPSFKTDIIWHAHMLNNEMYATDTKNIFGYILNHNDTIPKQKLDQGLKHTTDVWNKEYGASPYMALGAAAAGVVYLNNGPKKDDDVSSCVSTPDMSGVIFTGAGSCSNCSNSTSSCSSTSSCGGCGGCGGCGS